MFELKRFTTTAARLAEVWDLQQVGRTTIQDNENGRFYYLISAGTGANTMVPFSEQYGYVHFLLEDFRELDGAADTDVANIAANGGILASDTTPILLGDGGESQAIQWAASNNDAIGCAVDLPRDFDGTRAVSILATTFSAGTTNPGSLSVNTYWNGGTVITDTVTGVNNTTPTEYTGTIAAADIPDAPTRLTLSIITAAHTTDAVNLSAFALKYYRK